MPFAGIVRRDGVPPEWWTPWLDAPSSLELTHRGQHAVLLASMSARPAEPRVETNAPFITLLDGWLDDDSDGDSKTDDDACDQPVLLHTAVRQWGGRAADHLLGDFSLAVWDTATHELTLARDALGCRSLFFVRHHGALAFATSLVDLLRLPFLEKRVDVTKIQDRLQGRPQADAGATIYQEVRAVPAGHRLTVAATSGTVHEERYWSFSRATPHRRASDDAYVDEFRRTLTRAVECRMTGARTVAVHLSGGLDSSAIACIAARVLARQQRRLIAVCSVLPAGHHGVEEDERAYMEAVLAQEPTIDVEWIETPIDVDPLSAVDRVFEDLGSPMYAPAAHIEERLGEAGRRRGVDTILSGFGGDFCASWRGNTVVRTLLLQGRLLTAMGELASWRRRQGATWWRTLRQHVVGPMSRTWWSPRVDISHRWPPARQMQFVFEPGRLEQVLAALSQRFSRRFGQRMRFPLLDRRLIAFVMGAPVEQLQRQGHTRSLMRRAMEGVVPEIVRLRPDKGAAFDPLLAGRVAAHRERIAAWTDATASHPCWRVVNRQALLDGLKNIQPSNRAGWTNTMFVDVLMACHAAMFLQWHDAKTSRPWL